MGNGDRGQPAERGLLGAPGRGEVRWPGLLGSAGSIRAGPNAADLYWQTSWPDDHRIWTAPDIYAPPIFEAYRRNPDPALDAILAIGEHVPG